MTLSSNFLEAKLVILLSTDRIWCLFISTLALTPYHCTSEEVDHDFRGIQLLLTRIICQVQFLLTQRVDLS